MRFLCALAIAISPITRFPGFFHGVAPVKLSVFLLALGSWLVGKVARARRCDVGQPVAGIGTWLSLSPQFAVLLFALPLWTLITFLVAESPAAKGAGPVLTQLTVLAFFCIFLDITFAREQESWRFLRVLVVSAAAVGCLAILQYVVMQFGVLRFLAELIIPKIDRDLMLTGASPELPPWGYRSWGTFHHFNLLGIFLALAFPIAAICMMGSRRRLDRQLYALAALLIVGGIFCSGSRGAWLNVSTGTAFLLILGVRRIPKAPLLPALAALCFLGLIFQGEIRQYFRIGSGLSNRDIIWNNSWQMITERPLVGWGPGAFSRSYLDRFGFPSYIERGTAERELEFLGRIDLLDYWHAHNLFLHNAAEMGLLAAVLVLLLFFFYFRALMRYRPLYGAHRSRDLLVSGCSAAVLGNFVHSFFETSTNIAYSPLGIPFALVFAVGLAEMARGRKPSGSKG